MFRKPQNILKIPGPIFKTVLSLTEKDLVPGTTAVTMSGLAMSAKVSKFSVAFMVSINSKRSCLGRGYPKIAKRTF